jgi:hypothetical protein
MAGSLEALSDEALFEQTKYRAGLALRARSNRDNIRLWMHTMECEEEWKRRGKGEEYLKAINEEKKEARR